MLSKIKHIEPQFDKIEYLQNLTDTFLERKKYEKYEKIKKRIFLIFQ